MKLVKFGDLYLELIGNLIEGWSFRPTFYLSSESDDNGVYDPWKFAEVGDIVILASAEEMRSQYPTRNVTDIMKERAGEADEISEIGNSTYSDYFYIKLKSETRGYSKSEFCWDFMMFSYAFKILKILEIEQYVIYDYISNTCICKIFETIEQAEKYIYYDIARKSFYPIQI